MKSNFLITGASGQDGTMLTSLLSEIQEDFQVVLQSRTMRNGKSEITSKATWLKCDLENPNEVIATITELRPKVVWHLAGASSVEESWTSPARSIAANSISTANLLEAVRRESPTTRVVLAGSSEIFARVQGVVSERSEIRPSSPYGVSKATNLDLGRIYREVHGIRVSTAIMFNHESPLRPPSYVSRSIARQVASILSGSQEFVSLRDPGASKDWGWAEDFVLALYRMGLSDSPMDLVLATGERTSVRELAEYALASVGLSVDLIQSSSQYETRPNDQMHPIGDPSLAKSLLNWRARLTPSEFMPLMVLAELDRASVEGPLTS